MRRKLTPLILILSLGCSSDTVDLYHTPLAKSIIHLSLKNDLTDTLSTGVFLYTNIPNGTEASEKLSLISAGDYYLHIAIDRPAKSFLNLGNNEYILLLSPFDTTQVKINEIEQKLEISFIGNLKSINEYYLRKTQSLGYNDIRLPINKSISSLATYNSLKTSIDSIVNQELSILESFIKSHDLPIWFINYENCEIVYAGADFKMTLPLYNSTYKIFKDTLPGDYYSFLDVLDINNKDAILSTSYFWFLDDYFLIKSPYEEFEIYSGFSRLIKLHPYTFSQSNDQLSGIVHELYNKYRFRYLAKYCSDATVIDSLAKVFHLSDYWVQIKQLEKGSNIKVQTLMNGDTIPNFMAIDESNNSISLSDFDSQIIYINFWATWCKPCLENMPALNDLILHYKQDNRVSFINICLDCQEENWLTTINKYRIKGINLLLEEEWNSKLKTYFNIDGIPHYVIIDKGNILYQNHANKAPAVKNKIDDLLNTYTDNASIRVSKD